MWEISSTKDGGRFQENVRERCFCYPFLSTVPQNDSTDLPVSVTIQIIANKHLICLQILTNELRSSTEGEGWAAEASNKLSFKENLNPCLLFSPLSSLSDYYGLNVCRLSSRYTVKMDVCVFMDSSEMAKSSAKWLNGQW